MTDERIEDIKSAVEGADHIPTDKKAELLALLANLKPAIAKVAQTHPEDAHRIARSVEASAHAVARENKPPEHFQRAVLELKQSVEKFEASHPDLAAFVSRYSTLLSALGI
jgi:tRNA A37 N6-isopentenylltransferase MiaA